GFRDSGFRIRNSGFGIRDSGFGIRISGFGLRVSGFRIRVSGFWGGWAPGHYRGASGRSLAPLGLSIQATHNLLHTFPPCEMSGLSPDHSPSIDEISTRIEI
ncbi:hypothetical protein T484DRAFT_3636169, partial [Baffinella frigidus]